MSVFGGVAIFFMVEMFFSKRIVIFGCFNQSWGNPNLDKKNVQKMKKKKATFYSSVFFWLQAFYPKPVVNSGILKNRKKHYKQDFFTKAG